VYNPSPEAGDVAELKTQESPSSVADFIAQVPHPTRRADAEVLRQMMADLSGEQARMWGSSIVGFGRYDYTYTSGHSGSWARIGFSPRKSSLSVYLMPGFEDQGDLLGQLGKHKLGKSCLYINKLADVDLAVLRQLVKRALDVMSARYD
jgi:hypothetical protein